MPRSIPMIFPIMLLFSGFLNDRAGFSMVMPTGIFGWFGDNVAENSGSLRVLGGVLAYWGYGCVTPVGVRCITKTILLITASDHYHTEG